MDKKKLKKIEQKIRSLRNGLGNIRSIDLIKIATKLGRVLHSGGKHPQYVNSFFSDLHPISIPSHSVGVNPWTAQSILDDLESYDVERWKQLLE